PRIFCKICKGAKADKKEPHHAWRKTYPKSKLVCLMPAPLERQSCYGLPIIIRAAPITKSKGHSSAPAMPIGLHTTNSRVLKTIEGVGTSAPGSLQASWLPGLSPRKFLKIST